MGNAAKLVALGIFFDFRSQRQKWARNLYSKLSYFPPIFVALGIIECEMVWTLNQ